MLIALAFIIISLTYLGAGAYLRDRQRTTEQQRARGGGDSRR